jgi:molybdopterin-guanine dinucleotide biosynthesis protein A
VVLAGGLSRRLGIDKAEIGAPGENPESAESLTGRAAARLAAVCRTVAVADGGRRRLPDLASVGDGPGAGPAAGILGAARAYPGRTLLVLACDLPRVPSALLAELARSAGCDWALPRWSRGLEPLCALYRPRALAALAERVAAGLLAPHRLGESAGLVVRFLDGEALADFGPPEDLFLNLNTPADLARWRELEAAGGADGKN